MTALFQKNFGFISDDKQFFAVFPGEVFPKINKIKKDINFINFYETKDGDILAEFAVNPALYFDINSKLKSLKIKDYNILKKFEIRFFKMILLNDLNFILKKSERIEF